MGQKASKSKPANPLAVLRQNLVRHFSKEELQTLFFDLGFDHEELPDNTKGVVARELVAFLERHERIADLICLCRQRRPNVRWGDLPGPSEPRAWSEDGEVIANDIAFPPPRPEFSSNFLRELETPGGAVKLRDQLYIERDADAHFRREIAKRNVSIGLRQLVSEFTEAAPPCRPLVGAD